MKFGVIAATLAASLYVAAAHDPSLPVNPLLGVPGFPDCVRPLHLPAPTDVESAAMELVCSQRGTAGQIKIGTVGDSITAGAHSSGANHTYPSQLQFALEKAYPGKYAVTNLGACGSTMLKTSNSPYWERPQYKTLTSNTWDIIIIMLGTNDAKDTGSGGPNNWLHNCGGPDATTLEGCTFADDYQSMINVVSGLGTTSDGPVIYVAIPPPLMQEGSIGANQTVINSVYPRLVPMIHDAAKLSTNVININGWMGGVKDWQQEFPSKCELTSPWKPCAWWCDAQSCDQCHPNDDGYTHLAEGMQKGIHL